MSKTKGGGSTRNGRDSNAQRLGVKVFDGTKVTGGSINVRQRGTRFHPGRNVGIGKDDTGYGLTTEVIGYLPGLEQAQAEDLMQKANQVCPYSKATRGNVESRVLTKVL